MWSRARRWLYRLGCASAALPLGLGALACGGRAAPWGVSDGDGEPDDSPPVGAGGTNGTSAPILRMSGDYDVATSGEVTPCTQLNEPSLPQLLAPSIHLHVEQNASDPAKGTVSVDGTGELMLDMRAFPATFSGSSFSVSVSGPLSAVCDQQYDFSLFYDFAGGRSSLRFFFERSPTCSGNSGSVHCEGRIDATLGAAKRR